MKNRTIAATPDVTEVVRRGCSAAEQIIALPLGSVVIIRSSSPRAAIKTVLHRTGIDGWLSTRGLDGARPKDMSGYYGRSNVLHALASYEEKGYVFELAAEGNE